MDIESFESRELVINKLIEDLASSEEMNPDDIFSDIRTFSEIYETDEDAGAYLMEVAERIGIPFEEMLEHAKKLKGE